MSDFATRFAVMVLLMLTIAQTLVGCATQGMTIESTRASFQNIRKIVVAQLPGGAKRISPNGREFTSGYFVPDVTKTSIDATKDGERAYAFVKILGASRPYSINVQVFVEVRESSGRYVQDGLDQKLTQEIAQRIRDSLANRREDQNIIDDFRAF